MVSERRERAQVILIGAIALAFIILGIVVVFNGVLYTETLSSGSASQSASNADVVEHEVEQSIGCLLTKVDESGGLVDNAEDNITVFRDAYRNSKLESTTAAVNITSINVTVGGGTTQATVTITYDSAELSYERNQTIEAGCP
ncbi:hypothetical protein [Natrinema halophilum]|uniref:Uncharacterized protein n=1 Tax=Natrinema halophilum TaxID=1699371 RepID=A0A7D5L002_9EURY|nr:hypothetical protein [Natrinema halophilum]QLG50540.1 hypothetical protein HYG82_17660 [Natrinema halophilum]